MDPTEAVYEFVKSVPAGKVVTYGQVAGMIDGVSLSPREVGGIMSAAPPGLPWQRVVGAGGHLTTGKRSPELKTKQRALLEREGVVFRPNDCIDMAAHQWLADSFDPPEASSKHSKDV